MHSPQHAIVQRGALLEALGGVLGIAALVGHSPATAAALNVVSTPAAARCQVNISARRLTGVAR